MKIMKIRKVFAALMMAVVSLSLASCGLMGVDLTDQASVDKYLRKGLEKHIDPDAKIVSIRLGDTGDFVKSMGIATVELFEPTGEAGEMVSYIIQLGGNQEPRVSAATQFATYGVKKLTAEDGLKLADLDFSQIAAHINAGAELLAENDLAFDGIGDYTMELDKRSRQWQVGFTLESKAGTELGAQHGRAAMITSYYETNFAVDENGEVYVKE